MNTPDATISDHGSIVLLHPISEEAITWIDENIGNEAQYFGDALVIERRYVVPIVNGMRADGLEV